MVTLLDMYVLKHHVVEEERPRAVEGQVQKPLEEGLDLRSGALGRTFAPSPWTRMLIIPNRLRIFAVIYF